MSTIMLSNVLKWHSQGLTCLPCRTNSKAILKGYSKDSQLELPQYVNLFARSTLNACLVTGKGNDGRYLVVLDFDNPTFYTDLNTYTVKTRRGYHCYFWTLEDVSDMESERCEIKSRGSKVMLPGSIVDGFEYMVLNETVREIKRIDDVVDGATRRKDPMKEGKLSPYLSISISGDNNNVTVNLPSFSHRDTGRSPADMLAEIKSLIKITDIFDSPYYPVDNDRVLAHCPSPVHLNGDVNPSLSLDITRNRFRCFSPGCPFHLPRGGDVIDAYRIIHNLSFKEAVEQLAYR